MSRRELLREAPPPFAAECCEQGSAPSRPFSRELATSRDQGRWHKPSRGLNTPERYSTGRAGERATSRAWEAPPEHRQSHEVSVHRLPSFSACEFTLPQ